MVRGGDRGGQPAAATGRMVDGSCQEGGWQLRGGWWRRMEREGGGGGSEDPSIAGRAARKTTASAANMVVDGSYVELHDCRHTRGAAKGPQRPALAVVCLGPRCQHTMGIFDTQKEGAQSSHEIAHLRRSFSTGSLNIYQMG